MISLTVPSNVEKYDNIYDKGYNKRYPNLDLVRLQSWYFKNVPGHVLDFGCGTGTNLLHMLECGCSGIGIDASRGSVEVATRNLAQRSDLAGKWQILQLDANAQSLPFPDASFDYVLCLSVLSLLEGKERIQNAVDEFHRIMKPGAKMIVDINGPESDFQLKGRFIAEDTFEYQLRPDQAEPLRCYCPRSKEIFASLFEQFQVDDLGHVSFSYVGQSSLEFLACVQKSQ